MRSALVLKSQQIFSSLKVNCINKRKLPKYLILIFLVITSCRIKNNDPSRLLQEGYLNFDSEPIELLICPVNQNIVDCSAPPEHKVTLTERSNCTSSKFDIAGNKDLKFNTTALKFNGSKIMHVTGNITMRQLCYHAQSFTRPVIYLEGFIETESTLGENSICEGLPGTGYRPNVEMIVGAVDERTDCSTFPNSENPAINNNKHQTIIIKIGNKCRTYGDISLKESCEQAKTDRLPHFYWRNDQCNLNLQEGVEPVVISNDTPCDIYSENPAIAIASIEYNGKCLSFSGTTRQNVCEQAKEMLNQ